jgi:hypothetical protein
MDPAGADARGVPDRGSELPAPEVRQEFSASGAAWQAVLGSGVQNVFFGAIEAPPVLAVSIAPPVGQLSEDLPLRGREGLPGELSGPGVQVLYGLGGCGKTRVALEAASAVQQDGTEVWWVSAAGQDDLEAGMRAVGRRLGVPDPELGYGDAADVIWQHLSVRREPWLLVLDNADDPQILAGAGKCVADGQGWLRPVPGQAGSVLVTSRDGRENSWGPWCARYRLPVLPDGEAALMLADYAGGRSGLGSAEDARLLAARLGGLPLAVKIAGAYLADAAATPAAYADAALIRSYRQYRDALDNRDLTAVFPVPGKVMTQEQARGLISRTWELTLDLLAARQMPEARLVLRLLACLADAPVPHELLLYPPTLAASPLLPGITGSRLWDTLKTLDGFGLIDLGTSGDGADAVPVARLHPLVRDTSHPAAGERLPFLHLAARLLKRAAGDAGLPEDPSIWPAWQLLAPHCTAVFDSLAADPDCPDDAAESAAYAAYMAARYQAGQASHAQTEARFRDVLAAQLRVLGPDHPDTLATRHQIAGEIAERRHYAEAETEFRDMLAARLRVLGPDHPDTLTTRHQIAWMTAAQGDWVGAEAEYRDVLAARLRVLGPDHPDTLTTRYQIALGIAARGDHAGTEAEYRDILAARLRILGPDHPLTLTTRLAMATQMAEWEDHAGAEAEYRDVLAAQLRILGPDHPDTLTTRHEVATEMAIQGDWAGAEAQYRDVLAAQLRILGPDHPDALASRHQIAWAIGARGNHARAEAEYRDVLAAELRVLGPDHPYTLSVRHQIAWEMGARGNLAGAEAEYRNVLAARQRVLGPDHPLTLTTWAQIAGVMGKQGNWVGAEAEYRKVLAARQRVLGPDHPETLATARWVDYYG